LQKTDVEVGVCESRNIHELVWNFGYLQSPILVKIASIKLNIA